MKRAIQLVLLAIGALLSMATSRQMPPPQDPHAVQMIEPAPEPEPEPVVIVEPEPEPAPVIIITEPPPPRRQFATPPP